MAQTPPLAKAHAASTTLSKPASSIANPPSPDYRHLPLRSYTHAPERAALIRILAHRFQGCPQANSHVTTIHVWEHDQTGAIIVELHCPDCRRTWTL